MTGTVPLRQRARSSRFLRTLAQTYAIRIVGSVGTLLVTIIVARALGPEGRGSYALAATVVTLGIQFSGLGLHSANTYLTARNRALASTLLANTLLVTILVGVVAGAVALVAPSVIAPTAALRGVTSAAICLWIAFGLGLILVQYLLLGLGDARTYNLGDLVSRITTLVAVAAVAATLRSSIALFVAASALGSMAGLVVLVRGVGRDGVRPTPPSSRLLVHSLAYGVRNYITAFFSLALIRADMLMVQHYLGNRQTGYYSVAVSVTDMLFIIPTVAGTLGFARMSAAASATERRRQGRQIATGTGLLMLFSTSLVALTAQPLIHVLFGGAYQASVTPLLLLLPGVLLLSINVIFNNQFAAAGMPWLMVWLPALTVALNLGLNTVVIPRYGISGASVTSSVCYGVQLAMSLAYQAATRKREHAE